MRAVVQRVSGAHVVVDGQEISRIGHGLLVYLGVQEGDTEADLEYLASKVARLRIFEDERGHMNRSAVDAGAQALVISQFTLLGDCRRGRRPSFTAAMAPEPARQMYERFIDLVAAKKIPTRGGRFGALMEVFSQNHGPVTILLDSNKTF